VKTQVSMRNILTEIFIFEPPYSMNMASSKFIAYKMQNFDE